MTKSLLIKPCIECKVKKEISEFYAHPQMRDGTVNVCKACHKDRMKKRRMEDPYVQFYERQRAKTPIRKELTKKVQNNWLKNNPEKVNSDRRKNPEKYKARSMVGNAIRDGRLVKGVCEVCGSDRSNAHHEDYSKPLEVRWLCHQHHSDIHPKWHRPYIEEVFITEEVK